MPLIDRLAWLADSSDDSLLTEALREAIVLIGADAADALRTRIAALEAEVTRLERLAAAPTPY